MPSESVLVKKRKERKRENHWAPCGFLVDGIQREELARGTASEGPCTDPHRSGPCARGAPVTVPRSSCTGRAPGLWWCTPAGTGMNTRRRHGGAQSAPAAAVPRGGFSFCIQSRRARGMAELPDIRWSSRTPLHSHSLAVAAFLSRSSRSRGSSFCIHSPCSGRRARAAKILKLWYEWNVRSNRFFLNSGFLAKRRNVDLL